MICAQRLHKLVLQRVYILKLVYHYVFKPLLPFQAYFVRLGEYIQRELDKVVIIKAEAFLLLIKIAVEYYVLGGFRFVVFLFERIQVHGYNVQIILRAVDAFFNLYHVPRLGKRHIPKG